MHFIILHTITVINWYKDVLDYRFAKVTGKGIRENP